MSDDLVKRLRAVDQLSVNDCFLQSHLLVEAAGRIRSLETEVTELRKWHKVAAKELNDAAAELPRSQP